MNYLVINMHPSENSFNEAVFKRLTDELERNDQTVDETKLSRELSFHHLSVSEYEDSLQGIYDERVRSEHRKIRKADHLIIVFPVWWGSFPSVGKAYLDRCLSYGFAYELEGETPVPLLENKKVSLIFTTGAPEAEFHASGMYNHMMSMLDISVFRFCGLDLTDVLHLGNVVQSSDEQRQHMLASVGLFVRKLTKQ